jgi:transcriptional regulator with XRE-family HTH domain
MGGGPVFAISKISKKLLEKLQRKPYRHTYLAEHVRRGIAYQIRALRDQRKWKQGTFAKYLGKPQSVVCRLEDPTYGKVTIQTLLEIANVFDVALEVRFLPYSTFICNTRDVSVPAMQVPEFKDDLGLSIRETNPINILVRSASEPSIKIGWLDQANSGKFISIKATPTWRQPDGGTQYVLQ